MALLEQQELLEAAPPRRLIVPRGHTAHWGVDPSTLRMAVAGVQPRDGALARWEATVPFAPLEGAQRLSALYTAAREHVEKLAGCKPWPGIVMVEQPSGSKQSVNLPFIYAVGVIEAAIYDGLLAVTGSPVRIEECVASWWKRRAVGFAGFGKPTRKKLGRTPVFEDYPAAVWARQNGYTGTSWDGADAWGIAEAARREIALEER